MVIVEEGEYFFILKRTKANRNPLKDGKDCNSNDDDNDDYDDNIEHDYSCRKNSTKVSLKKYYS